MSNVAHVGRPWMGCSFGFTKETPENSHVTSKFLPNTIMHAYPRYVFVELYKLYNAVLK